MVVKTIMRVLSVAFGFIFDFLDNLVPVIIRHAAIYDREIIAVMSNVEHIAITNGERFYNAHNITPAL